MNDFLDRGKHKHFVACPLSHFWHFEQCPLLKNIGVFNMSDNQKATVTGLMGLFFVIGLILGYLMTEEVYQNQAIEAGVGHFDDQTGTFKYKIVDEDSSM
jgi:hypothetical protein